jgi:hypothetical protein
MGANGANGSKPILVAFEQSSAGEGDDGENKSLSSSEASPSMRRTPPRLSARWRPR